MASKVVRDPIHGNIGLDGFFTGLVDTGLMQRLRNVKQNGLCYLVYPAMNSTRFEHSLGVYHLAGHLSDRIGLSEQDSITFKAASLLHDVGHGPFSHTFDVMGCYGFDHEKESRRIVLESEVSDVLREGGVKPSDVAELIAGKGRLGGLLSSEVDVDKMDYLVRDAYYAGVAYGVTDVERMLQSVRLEKGSVVVEEGGLEAAESLLINRNLMYQTVYRHHTKRIAESMMTHALLKLADTRDKAFQLAALDDIGLMAMMRSSKGYVRDITSRLDGRRLFKDVFSEKIVSLTGESRKELSENSRAVESTIAGDHGVKEGYLLLDYPEIRMSEFKVKVKTGEGLKDIGEVSVLAKSLEESEREKLTVNIYSLPEDRDKMKGFKPEDYFTYTQKRLTEWD
ncbi:MAG: HD domain-containing protein [Candidatus Altiarchaeales archaeon]|nr:HD domain-containing protein [Candidatus Altiarchaeales archaeon]MBD3416945.1 HD domain-containing protein [Candidatus Altiarchaeales archaeon]